jgi:anti-sigma factor RsiW
MTEHEKLKELISLGAAGALGESEERALAVHVARCEECAAELENWRELGAALRRVPTPQAPAQLVERVRAQMVAQGFAEMERRQNFRVAAWLGLVGWTVTLASWPLLRLLSNEAANVMDVQLLHTWYGLFAITVGGWVAAGAAAAMVALRHRQERRFA